MVMAKGKNKIVYSHLFMMATNTMDVFQVSIQSKVHGVQQKLIQMANLSRANGLDAMIYVK